MFLDVRLFYCTLQMRTVRILACVNGGVPIQGKVFNQEDNHFGSFPTKKIHRWENLGMVFHRWEPSLFLWHSLPQFLLYVAGGSCRGRGRGHDNQNCYLAKVFVWSWQTPVTVGQWPTHFYEGNSGPKFIKLKSETSSRQKICRTTSKIRFRKGQCWLRLIQ